MSKVRAIVVDDSALMRQLLTKALIEGDEIEVVATANDPLQAREKIKQFNPDVITLDIEMPNMDGLSFLEKIMRLRPMPVVMISTLTAEGTDATIRALELGAVDFHLKPNGASDFALQAADIREKVKVAARSRMTATRSLSRDSKPTVIQPGAGYRPEAHLLAIGSSTGGVEALHTILSRFPKNCPPTVITQHMPERFTQAFATRLDGKIQPHVAEATDNAVIGVGTILIAPGGERHLEVAQVGTQWRCRLVPGPATSGHRPSVDRLFLSVADTVGARAVGVILTGMGSDGATGLKAIRDKGGRTIGQSEASCVVYGMPRVAKEKGAVESELALDRIAEAVIRLCEHAS